MSVDEVDRVGISFERRLGLSNAGVLSRRQDLASWEKPEVNIDHLNKKEKVWQVNNGAK